MLDKPEARQLIWDEVVVDFSHELITAVHTPIAWSDKRPSNEEFQKSFKEVQLSASKILDFIRERRSSVKKIVLMSSEGYFSEVRLFWCTCNHMNTAAATSRSHESHLPGHINLAVSQQSPGRTVPFAHEGHFDSSIHRVPPRDHSIPFRQVHSSFSSRLIRQQNVTAT